MLKAGDAVFRSRWRVVIEKHINSLLDRQVVEKALEITKRMGEITE